MSLFDKIKNLFDKTPENARIFIVEGMHCVNCENHVKESISKLDGVQSVIANHKKNQVAVLADEKVSDEDIKAKITDAGFQVK